MSELLQYHPNSERDVDREFSRLIDEYRIKQEVDVEHGLTKRLVSTLEKHFTDAFPIVHITNDEVGLGPKLPIRSTGFVDSIETEGLRKFTNVGFIPSGSFKEDILYRANQRGERNVDYITEEEARKSPLRFLEAVDSIRKEFIHHGLRANKNKTNGKFSIPAVIIADGNVAKQAGYDSSIHAQINQSVSPEKILNIFQFDPEELVREFLETGKNSPKSLEMDPTGKREIPFRREFTSNDRRYRNEFIKEFLWAMGNSRLGELKALYDASREEEEKQKIALAAHDLVDSYLVHPETYDDNFSDLNEETKVQLENRRKKFALMKHFEERGQSEDMF